MEDSALSLKKDYYNNNHIDDSTALSRIKESSLVEQLLSEPNRSPDTFIGLRTLEWRLLELTEIPFTYLLDTVQKWIKILVDKTFLDEGFTLTGDTEGIFACHNALITKILIRMNYNNKGKIDAGINWILQYQSFSRDEKCSWSGKALYTKWGGCMKKTPCYYGVIKSLIALTEYKEKFGTTDEIEEKLQKGLQYILEHRIYKRLSTGEPIEASIIKNFYPWTYKSNILEILILLKANNLLQDKRCEEAIQLLKNKQRKDGQWQSDISFMKSSWVDFDQIKKPSLWISYEIERLL